MAQHLAGRVQAGVELQNRVKATAKTLNGKNIDPGLHARLNDPERLIAAQNQHAELPNLLKLQKLVILAAHSFGEDAETMERLIRVCVAPNPFEWTSHQQPDGNTYKIPEVCEGFSDILEAKAVQPQGTDRNELIEELGDVSWGFGAAHILGINEKVGIDKDYTALTADKALSKPLLLSEIKHLWHIHVKGTPDKPLEFETPEGTAWPMEAAVSFLHASEALNAAYMELPIFKALIEGDEDTLQDVLRQDWDDYIQSDAMREHLSDIAEKMVAKKQALSDIAEAIKTDMGFVIECNRIKITGGRLEWKDTAHDTYNAPEVSDGTALTASLTPREVTPE